MQTIILIAIITLLATRIPTLTTALTRNQQARQTTTHCQTPSSVSEAPSSTVLRTFGSRPSSNLWLTAITALCAQDHPTAHTQFAAIIQQSPHRLPAIRSANPYDTQLAQLAAQTYPHNPAAHFWLGDAHLHHQNPTAAIAAYEQGLALAPRNALSWRILGDLYRDNNYPWQTTVHAYDQACFLGDRGFNGCLRAARTYFDNNQYQLAADRYHRSLIQLPNYPAAHRGLAESHLALRDPTAARPHLQWLAAHNDPWAQEQLQNLK